MAVNSRVAEGPEQLPPFAVEVASNGPSHMILQRFIQLGYYIGVVPFFISSGDPLEDRAKATSSVINCTT